MTADFDQDFVFSTSPGADALVRRACHRLIENCCGVSRATPNEDRRGIDYWVITPHSRTGLDLKLRSRDYAAGKNGSIDCVIELNGWGNTGWLLKAGGADLILFACIDTGRFALFETKNLRTAVMVNLSRWIADGRVREIETTSYRDGQHWKNRAVIVSADLLTEAIDRLDETDWIGAGNDWVGR